MRAGPDNAEASDRVAAWKAGAGFGGVEVEHLSLRPVRDGSVLGRRAVG